MIISLLLNIFLGFVNLIFGLLPTGSLPTGVASALTNIYQTAYQFNTFLPIDIAFVLLQWVIGFWAIMLLWDFSKWLIHLIRGN